MRKTLNINLGGLAFIMDENAFDALFNYLEALKNKFGNQAERDEIINDIEARIAEMLSQRLGNRKEVVSIEDVAYVTGIMGKPEDIAGDEPVSEPAASASAESAPYTAPGTEKVERQLFRDPDDAKIGGVIAGLCHYFGISDPTWARVLAIVFIPLTSGSIILVYLLLLIIVPKATSSADKLKMKGVPVNISTIEKEVKEAAERFGATVKSSIGPGSFFERLGKVLVSVFTILAKIAAVFLIIGAVIALVASLVFFISGYVVANGGLREQIALLVSKPGDVTLLNTGWLLVCAMPLVALIYLGLKILLNGRGVRWLKWVLLSGWVAGIVMCVVAGCNIGFGFKEEARIERSTFYPQQPPRGTLFVQVADSTARGWKAWEEEDEDGSFPFVSDKSGSNYRIGRPDVQVTASENDSFYIDQQIIARGGNNTEAAENAAMVQYHCVQADTTLYLPKYYTVPKQGGRFRGQQLKITIAVPLKKTIHFGGSMDELNAEIKNDDSYDATGFANTTWINEAGKIKCLNCKSGDISDGHYHSSNDDMNDY